MHNLNYIPTALGVQSWSEITSGGTRTKPAAFRWPRLIPWKYGAKASNLITGNIPHRSVDTVPAYVRTACCAVVSPLRGWQIRERYVYHAEPNVNIEGGLKMSTFLQFGFKGNITRISSGTGREQRAEVRSEVRSEVRHFGRSGFKINLKCEMYQHFIID
jgi:hypothetical protein